MKSQTFELLYDYTLFRLHNSAVKRSKLIDFPLPCPTLLSQKMRFLGHKFSNDGSTWPQLTDQKDFSISNYENFRTCVHSGFENCEMLTPKFIYAYFEFTSICGVFAVSTSVYGPNLKDICHFATEYLCSSSKFVQFLFQHNGWESFLTMQYCKYKAVQEGIFKQWLQVLDHQECL